MTVVFDERIGRLEALGVEQQAANCTPSTPTRSRRQHTFHFGAGNCARLPRVPPTRQCASWPQSGLHAGPELLPKPQDFGTDLHSLYRCTALLPGTQCSVLLSEPVMGALDTRSISPRTPILVGEKETERMGGGFRIFCGASSEGDVIHEYYNGPRIWIWL